MARGARRSVALVGISTCLAIVSGCGATAASPAASRSQVENAFRGNNVILTPLFARVEAGPYVLSRPLFPAESYIEPIADFDSAFVIQAQPYEATVNIFPNTKRANARIRQLLEARQASGTLDDSLRDAWIIQRKNVVVLYDHGALDGVFLSRVRAALADL